MTIKIDNSPHPLTFGAIGDSYGFCFEFAEADFVARNNDLSYHPHPSPEMQVQPGAYSDDTQMQLALAELIVSGYEWHAERVAESFLATFKRDPRPGYAKKFQAFLEQVNNGTEFLDQIRADSERNGAAMRAPIVGLFPDIKEVISKADLQARLTHNTKGGVDSAVAAALLCHFFTYDLGPKGEAPKFLENHVPGHNWEEPWRGKVEVHGISTVRAALTAIVKTDSLAELLIECINYTGDVDSVATIALACASCSRGFQRDIPDTLWSRLESGPFGRDYLIDIDRKVREVLDIY